MRYGLLSDIHGNLAALQAALSVIQAQGVDGYLCAGDVVGYGPQPNECVALVASLGVHCVAGNHDLIATGKLSDEGLPRLARRTLEWTRAALEPSARAWLEALPRRTGVRGVIVTHASLTGPRRYASSDEVIREELALLAHHDPTADVLVLGHTHRAAAFGERSGRVVDGAPAMVRLGEHERWMLNPGAVGQSRERCASAWVAVLDVERRTAAFHAITYDVATTRAELRRHKLPLSAIHSPPRRRPRELARRVARLAGLVASTVALSGANA